MSRIFFLLFFTLLLSQGFGQISLNFPVERSVFQRANDNFGFIAINGTSSQKMDSLIAQFETNSVITRKKMTNTTAKGYFQERIKMPGGWYKLSILAYKNGEILHQQNVEKVGVGEVFILCGQSNAQGVRNYGAKGAKDDRVNSVNFFNENLSFTPPDELTISKIEDNSDIAPYGKSPWCWGELGDMIAERFDVPVLFFNASWQATFSSNWSDSRDEIPAFDILTFGTLPLGYPYHHLELSHKYYASLFGVRAVLWHLGETDTNPGIPRPGEYYKYIKYTIEKSREDFGFNVPWMISEVSYSYGETSEVVLQDQRDLINTVGLNTFQGPLTDPLMQPRYDGIHFGNTERQNGLQELAQAWFEKIEGGFLDETKPILTNPLTALSIECNSDGLSLKPQKGQSIYKWNDNSNDEMKTAISGQFGAIVLDSVQNYKIGTSIDIDGIKFEADPLIKSTSNTFCEGDSLLISSVEVYDAVLWSNERLTNSFFIKDNIELTYQAFNAYGCKIGTSQSESYTKIDIPDFVLNPSFEINNGFYNVEDNTVMTCESKIVEIEAIGDWKEFSWNDAISSKRIEVSRDTLIQFSGTFDNACPSVEPKPIVVTFVDLPLRPLVEQDGPYTLKVTNADIYGNKVVLEWLQGSLTLSSTGRIYRPLIADEYSSRAVFYLENGDGCGSPLSNLVSFKTNPSQEIIILYPNPTPNIISVAASKVQERVSIKVFNSIGMELSSTDLSSWNGESIPIDLTALAAGYYSIEVISSENHVVKKVFKY